jgi:Peptidase family M13
MSHSGRRALCGFVSSGSRISRAFNRRFSRARIDLFSFLVSSGHPRPLGDFTLFVSDVYRGAVILLSVLRRRPWPLLEFAPFVSGRSSRLSLHDHHLTGDQRFFISYGQSWRNKVRDAELRKSIVTGGHAPPQYRAATVRNLDAWYAAFGPTAGQKLYLSPVQRVRVW